MRVIRSGVMIIRSFGAALCHIHRATSVKSLRCFSSSIRRDADFTHAVIGAGVVGLAVARRLQQTEGAQVVLIEKHGIIGSETSSRNSEVVHAGLYYGDNSLKTRLCIQGKRMMYDLCARQDIPHMNCGKWIVAQTEEQMQTLENIHALSKRIGVPTRFISKDEARRREPDVRAEAGTLESPTTGIVDSHSFMQFLLGDFENEGGITALASPVSKITVPNAQSRDWKIWTAPTHVASDSPSSQHDESRCEDEDDAFITAESVVNSAGLYACAINNMIFPPERHRTQYYAKGNYFGYSKSRPKPSTLIYPAPVPGHGGLGTHLTIDMSGRVRFGPDVEWVERPDDLAPNAKAERFAAALEDIKSYLPGIDADAVTLDYCGIRPKLGRSGIQTSEKSNFIDFYIEKEEEFPGFINLLGIESPGLTSSLAIGEYVHRLLYK